MPDYKQLILRFILLSFCFNAGLAEELVTFNRDIRPILSDKCFACHGPDGSKRKAELRLDVQEHAFASGAITPGEPDNSELLSRVLSQDPDLHMPPAASKLESLTAEETDLLRRWIHQGAKYENHWAFIPIEIDHYVQKSAVEQIDSLVQTGLSEKGLTLQPQADRHTLIRRLSFDLTGLPPSVNDIQSFISDTSPDAVEKLVDRLLSSPQYGERMAVDWLDSARYADSFGFQVDRERDVWHWRDWVIQSFNRNMPFNEFITWQLAGDLLPDPSDEQILATAFNRLHQQESEGGSVEEEYRVEYVCDRVQTVATAFLGLTFECARCHDHKYDPISQREYYQLFAMFQNIDEAGLYSYFTMSPPTPALTLTDEKSREQLKTLSDSVTLLEQQSDKLMSERQSAFEQWLKSLSDSTDDKGQTSPAAIALPELAAFTFDELNDGKLANRLSADQPGLLRGENRLVPGHEGQAIEFTGDDPVDLPLGNFRREEPFSVSLWMKVPAEMERAVVFHRSRAWTDAASRGYELLIEEGRLKWSLIHFWPGNAISVRTPDLLPLNEWVHVTVSSDGGSKANGLGVYINGKQVETTVIRDHLTREITGGGGDNIALGERFRDRGFRGGLIDDFRVFSRRLSGLEALSIFDQAAAKAIISESKANLSEHERNLLFDHFLAATDSEWKQHLANLQNARAEKARLFDSLKEIMVMSEMAEPKKAWVLFRGEYQQRREEVHAGTPAALSPFPENTPKNRLGLAKWLTAPGHPLTARVTVNRVWQSLFGRGLVRTSEDFGSQGARPLYPGVLDALSAHFIHSGWNLKQLVKNIVLSKTYQQRSIADVKTMQDDPDNEWLARGPRFRLSAEMIRDNALSAAGLLKTEIGGPPVFPYEMTEAFKPAKASEGDGVYRRSIYTSWRRTGPPPAMLTFDAPRRAVCTAKRERTDSPLQALVLLNGTQYVEAARVLGELLHKESSGDVKTMIELGCLRCLSRKPDAREAEILTALYNEQHMHFKNHESDAAEFLKIGQSSRDASIALADAAAATILAQALLNHDECVVKR